MFKYLPSQKYDTKRKKTSKFLEKVITQLRMSHLDPRQETNTNTVNPSIEPTVITNNCLNLHLKSISFKIIKKYF